MKDSSKWKLKLLVFEALCDVSWTSDIDLSASRVSHQLLCYISRKLDPFSRDRDAFQMPWKHQEGRTFPPFSLIGRVKWKGSNRPDPNFTKNYMAESVSLSVFTSSPYINKESNFNAQSRFF